jgi:hypothetical protein
VKGHLSSSDPAYSLTFRPAESFADRLCWTCETQPYILITSCQGQHCGSSMDHVAKSSVTLLDIAVHATPSPEIAVAKLLYRSLGVRETRFASNSSNHDLFSSPRCGRLIPGILQLNIINAHETTLTTLVPCMLYCANTGFRTRTRFLCTSFKPSTIIWISFKR